MNPQIADDIELLVRHALDNFNHRTSTYKAAQRIEAWLATYQEDKTI